jgi:hypothetical protein
MNVKKENQTSGKSVGTIGHFALSGFCPFILRMAIVIIASVAFIACDKTDDTKPVEVTAVTINQPPASAELVAGGGTLSLSVTVEPANAPKTVTWSSSNTAIATVSSAGVVTGVKEGSVTITATSQSGNKSAEYTLTVKPDPKASPVVLTSPITVNTTLKDLGLEVDYIYNGNDQLSVQNNATLTIEPGVTIKFAHTGKRGGILIKANSTINAVGTSSKRIQFIGTNNEKGSWVGINLESNTDNQFAYCDFLNAGSWDRTDAGALYLVQGAKVGISHCKFTNGNGYAIVVSDYGGVCQFSAFNNNVIEGYEYAPVYIAGNLKQLEKFDMTSELSNNKLKYIEIHGPYASDPVTINQTTVPYYFRTTITLRNNLTINEGVTVYLTEGNSSVGYDALVMINGTAAKKVKFTRVPGGAQYYWAYISFGPGSVVKHCIIEYGGKNTGMIGIISTTKLTLENVEINNSDTYGASTGANNCGWVINHSNVTFSNNRSGNFWDRCPFPNAIRPNFP